MNKYTFTLKHDDGKHKLTVAAKNLASATQQILNAEGCPEQAITKIKIKIK